MTVSKAHIFFNRPFATGAESDHVQHVIASRRYSGDGVFTRNVQHFFEQKFGFGKSLLTPSCTAALEMASLLLNIQPGDEVIIPSYTFVSTANAFALRGAKIVFADSCSDHPNINPEEVAKLVSHKTKAIVVVHYGGSACDMNAILEIASGHDIPVVEDAAHCFSATHSGKFLGTFGNISTMSFHETKNVTCGEGGLICINDKSLYQRAEIIREKGTNRKAFERKETDRYSWVDLGSSYLMSEFSAAILSAQLERAVEVTRKRTMLCERYQANLLPLMNEGIIGLSPGISDNGHLFYITCKSLEERTALTKFLYENGIDAVFHYLSLHNSPFFQSCHDGRELANSDRFMFCLLRLPLYFDLELSDIDRVCQVIYKFYRR
jgi:dTDP-4-amino-4,6-dideoxygalactose transaminase